MRKLIKNLLRLTGLKKGCDYTGQDFGASYNDSCCIDGFLFDLDSGDNPGEVSFGGIEPCPQCNHHRWLKYHKGIIFSDGYEMSERGESRPTDVKPRFKKDKKIYLKWQRAGWDYARMESKK